MNGCKCQNKLRYDGAYYVVLPLNTKNERERVSSIALGREASQWNRTVHVRSKSEMK